LDVDAGNRFGASHFGYIVATVCREQAGSGVGEFGAVAKSAFAAGAIRSFLVWESGKKRLTKPQKMHMSLYWH
jgi:hypothetical protein